MTSIQIINILNKFNSSVNLSSYNDDKILVEFRRSIDRGTTNVVIMLDVGCASPMSWNRGLLNIYDKTSLYDICN